MKEDTTILPFRQSEKIDDPLTEIAREGARRMLAEALVAEADAFVASFSEERLADGRQRIVRHGFGPERQLQTGIGAVEVRRPKVRDRISSQPETAKVRFTSISCLNGRVGQQAWMPFCRYYICAGFPRAIFRRH